MHDTTNNGLQVLLRIVEGAQDEVESESHISFGLHQATWSEGSLEIALQLTAQYHDPRWWVVNCQNVAAYTLSETWFSHLRLTNEHPVLWAYKYEIRTAYFKGVPTNTNAAVLALFEAHLKTVGSWIPFTYSPVGLIKQLNSGNGFLASGPAPLLEIYREVLAEHAVSVSIVGGYRNRWTEHYHDMRALLLGESSYILAHHWTAKEVSGNEDSLE